MDNNSVGNHSELKVATDLSEHGNVSIPTGQPAYDLIFDNGNELFKVQVKTGYKSGQRNEGHAVNLIKGNENHPYAVDDFDILAVTAPDFDKIAYWPWNEKAYRQTITIWFHREKSDFRECNKNMVNIADRLSLKRTIERLK